MDSISKSKVIGMIEKYGDVIEVKINYLNRGVDVWRLKNSVPITLPVGNARVSMKEVEMIAFLKLRISEAEFEYWLNEDNVTRYSPN